MGNADGDYAEAKKREAISQRAVVESKNNDPDKEKLDQSPHIAYDYLKNTPANKQRRN